MGFCQSFFIGIARNFLISGEEKDEETKAEWWRQLWYTGNFV